MTRSITLVQINDVHGYLEHHPEVYWGPRGLEYGTAGGYARIARLVDDIRRERPEGTMVFDGGDTLHGTFPVVQSQAAIMPSILNRIGFDAMTAHWEFAYGPDTFLQRASELEYPVLASNVYRTDDGSRPFQPTMVKEVGGLRVGVVGLASHIVDKTMPPHFSTGLRFEVGVDTVRELVDDLRTRERVDLVVVLSHLGFPQDMQLAKDVEGIDVIVSAHTHNRLETPAAVGSTLVIQSGAHGSFVGCLDVEVDGGRVTDYRHRLLGVGREIEPDPEMTRIIDEIMVPHREMLGEVVGRTEQGLNRATSVEATMDNLMLDAMLAQTGAQVAFANGWRYGAPIPPGEITMNDLWNMVPMNPPVSTVDLRGDELVEMLEENLERTYAHDPYAQMGGYLKRMAGAQVYLRVENPRGQHIQRMFIGGEEVRPGRVYRAVFITAQGVGRRYGTNRADTGYRAIDVLKAYLAGHDPLREDIRGTYLLV